MGEGTLSREDSEAPGTRAGGWGGGLAVAVVCWHWWGLKSKSELES